MTRKEFLEYQKTGKYPYHPIIVDEMEDQKLTPNQSCSIEELLKRQAQGLPLPNLTPIIHTAYNGYDIDNIPSSASRSADVIDIQREMKATKEDIVNTEAAYQYEMRLSQEKIKKNKQNKTE